MSEARDISHLFSQLGESGSGYRELAKDTRAVSAEERWPLLGAVRVDQAKTAPPAANGDHVAPSAFSRPLGRGAVTHRPMAPKASLPDPKPPGRDDSGLPALFARLAGEESAREGIAPAPSLFWPKKAL